MLVYSPLVGHGQPKRREGLTHRERGVWVRSVQREVVTFGVPTKL